MSLYLQYLERGNPSTLDYLVNDVIAHIDAVTAKFAPGVCADGRLEEEDP